jgi:ABC-2 type transport system ATP-binding protein
MNSEAQNIPMANPHAAATAQASAPAPGGQTPAHLTGNLAISSHNLTKKFAQRNAVDAVNLAIPTGAIYALLGLNGAGKSTTIRMLLGLLTPTSGNVKIVGLDPARDDIKVKQVVGYVPDTPRFYEWMTVAEQIGFIAHYRKSRWDVPYTDHLVDNFQLPRGAQIRTLSKGQKARLALVAALGFRPDVLLLDEPTLGLDPVARRQFTESILSEYADEGRTVLISSHLIHEVSGVADWVGIMRNGNLIRQQPNEELRAQVKQLELTFSGDVPPTLPPREGLLKQVREPHGVTLTIDHFNPDQARQYASRVGADSVKINDLSLEEVFVALAQGEN